LCQQRAVIGVGERAVRHRDAAQRPFRCVVRVRDRRTPRQCERAQPPARVVAKAERLAIRTRDQRELLVEVVGVLSVFRTKPSVRRIVVGLQVHRGIRKGVGWLTGRRDRGHDTVAIVRIADGPRIGERLRGDPAREIIGEADRLDQRCGQQRLSYGREIGRRESSPTGNV